MEITRALADSSRVRALMVLRERELCVCQIVTLLKFAPSTISKHMSLLKQAGLVQTRKEGRWVYYRIADEETQNGPIAQTLSWLTDTLADSEQIRQDSHSINEIVQLDPASLCQIGFQKEGDL